VRRVDPIAFTLAATAVACVCGSQTACSQPCMGVVGVVRFVESPTDSSLVCTVTIRGTAGTGVYTFAPWKAGDVPCTVTSGPAAQCTRTHTTDLWPQEAGIIARDASLQPTEDFVLTFLPAQGPESQAYFGGNPVATLACGPDVIDQRTGIFGCVLEG
jgi:hypothetical protein